MRAKCEADQNAYITALLTLTDISCTHFLNSVGVRLKGNSSYSHPGGKKSFTIDFNRFIGGQHHDGLKSLVSNRLAHVSSQMECQTASATNPVNSPPIEFPNPARDEAVLQGFQKERTSHSSIQWDKRQAKLKRSVRASCASI